MITIIDYTSPASWTDLGMAWSGDDISCQKSKYVDAIRLAIIERFDAINYIQYDYKSSQADSYYNTWPPPIPGRALNSNYLIMLHNAIRVLIPAFYNQYVFDDSIPYIENNPAWTERSILDYLEAEKCEYPQPHDMDNTAWLKQQYLILNELKVVRRGALFMLVSGNAHYSYNQPVYHGSEIGYTLDTITSVTPFERSAWTMHLAKLIASGDPNGGTLFCTTRHSSITDLKLSTAYIVDRYGRFVCRFRKDTEYTYRIMVTAYVAGGTAEKNRSFQTPDESWIRDVRCVTDTGTFIYTDNSLVQNFATVGDMGWSPSDPCLSSTELPVPAFDTTELITHTGCSVEVEFEVLETPLFGGKSPFKFIASS